MEGYKNGDSVFVSVLNLEEFKILAKQAETELEQLRKTIGKLQAFDIEVRFSFGSPTASE